jgi:hypothetical protein
MVLVWLDVEGGLILVDVGLLGVLIEVPVDNAKSVGVRRSAAPQKCGYEKVLGGGLQWSDGDKVMLPRRLDDG